jgi:acyl-CoA thioester hydrolase
VVKRPRPAPGYPLAVPVEVRFRDIDSMGHVNNAVYLTYFENARIAYWRAVPGIGSRREVDYVLARAECDFRSPVTLDDDLACHVRVASFGRRSFAFEYLLRDEKTGRVAAEGRTVQAMYDYARRRVKILDEPLKEAIRAFEKRDIPERAAAGPGRGRDGGPPGA